MLNETRIEEAVRLLHQAAPSATIILFGSYARGDAGEDSDLDLLVIEPKLASKREEAVRLRDALRPLRVPVDLVVTSQDTFEKWADTPGTLYYEVAKEGKIFREVA